MSWELLRWINVDKLVTFSFRRRGAVSLERQAEQMSRVLVVVDVVLEKHLKAIEVSFELGVI